jgi:hypothetical protein
MPFSVVEKRLALLIASAITDPPLTSTSSVSSAPPPGQSGLLGVEGSYQDLDCADDPHFYWLSYSLFFHNI